MRHAISDPTAGQRARDINALPAGTQRRVDPTDPRYQRVRANAGHAMPSPDPTDPTYPADVEAEAGRPGSRGARHRRRPAPPAEDPTEPHPELGGEMRVLVRRSGRSRGTSLPTVIAARPVGHVHGLAGGEGPTEHMKVVGSPVGQVFGRSRTKRLRASPAGLGYVLRLRGLRSS